MIVVLPERFEYGDNHGNRAYVKDGILYVEGNVGFEDLMYSLAYAVYGKRKCYYCGRRLNRKKVTLDHKYPRCWGGISVPNNLVPCCRSCNSQKGNMNAMQYRVWLSTSEKKRHKFYTNFVVYNERGMKLGFPIPKEWIVMLPVEQLARDIDFSDVKRTGNKKMNLYFELHGYYPGPVVISDNGWVFKGFHILYHAKTHGIKKVYCVKLENVVRVNKK